MRSSAHERITRPGCAARSIAAGVLWLSAMVPLGACGNGAGDINRETVVLPDTLRAADPELLDQLREYDEAPDRIIYEPPTALDRPAGVMTWPPDPSATPEPDSLSRDRRPGR